MFTSSINRHFRELSGDLCYDHKSILLKFLASEDYLRKYTNLFIKVISELITGIQVERKIGTKIDFLVL